MRDILIRMCASAGLSVRREPKRLLPDEPEIRPGDLVVSDWTIDGIQQTTHALYFTAPMICLMVAGGVSADRKGAGETR
jgi:hypothetical protein